MTSAGHLGDRLVTWEAAGEDCRIICPAALLESLRHDCSMAANSPAPLGAGGALLGEASAGTYRIRRWRPIPCRHQRGPSFLLSKEEVADLKDFLSQLPGRAPHSQDEIIGWFVSHPNPGAALREDEISLHQRFFRTKDLFLLLEIDQAGCAQITVHRGAMPLDPPWRIEPAPAVSRRTERPARKARELSVGLAPADSAAVAGLAGEPPATAQLPPAHPRREPGPKRAQLYLTWLAAFLALGAASMIWIKQFRTPAPPTVLPAPPPPLSTLSLHVQRDGDRVLIRWNAHSALVRGARRTRLIVAESGRRQERELSRQEAQAGFEIYRSTANRIEVIMQTENERGARRLERVLYNTPGAGEAARAEAAPAGAVEFPPKH